MRILIPLAIFPKRFQVEGGGESRSQFDRPNWHDRLPFWSAPAESRLCRDGDGALDFHDR